jgi:ABC-type glycerol-3-phosphate transport system substrate-binding protein
MLVPRLHKRTAHSFLGLCLGALVVLMLGCRAVPILPTPPETPTASSGSGKTTLILWHTLTDDKAKTLQDLSRTFHETYPDLTVTPVYVGSADDLTRQMTAAIALGTAPDLVLADRRQIGEFARQGGLQPLESFLDDPDLGLGPEDRTDLLRGTLDLGKYPSDGNLIYGFPFDQEALVLFYNGELLKNLNINGPPRTWDQFADELGTVTQDKTFGWSMRANADTFEAILVSRGSALLNNAETRALLNERAGLATLKLVADLSQGGQSQMATSDEKARAAFASGQAAFYMGWLSEYDTLGQAQRQAKTDFTIGVAPLPQLELQTPWLLTRGALFGIARLPHDRARNAWFFIRWMTAPTQSARWVRATNALPLRASALTFIAPDLPKDAHYRQIANGFDGILPSLAPQPAPPYIKTAEEQVSALWLEALQPKADLRALLDAAAARVNQILAVKP